MTEIDFVIIIIIIINTSYFFLSQYRALQSYIVMKAFVLQMTTHESCWRTVATWQVQITSMRAR